MEICDLINYANGKTLSMLSIFHCCIYDLQIIPPKDQRREQMEKSPPLNISKQTLTLARRRLYMLDYQSQSWWTAHYSHTCLWFNRYYGIPMIKNFLGRSQRGTPLVTGQLERKRLMTFWKHSLSWIITRMNGIV